MKKITKEDVKKFWKEKGEKIKFYSVIYGALIGMGFIGYKLGAITNEIQFTYALDKVLEFKPDVKLSELEKGSEFYYEFQEWFKTHK